jgi:predicted Zn-dependent protease
MNRIGIAIGLWVLGTGCAFAAPAQARLDAIWAYAHDRIDQQIDIWFEEGDFPAAIAMLRVKTEASPKDYDALTNLGWMLENVEEWDSAEAVYVRFHRENPQEPDGALPLAEYYFRRRNYPPIPGLLESKVKMARKPHPNVFRILAHAYERTGKLQESQRTWKDYIALAPNDGAAKVNLQRVEKKIANPTK